MTAARAATPRATMRGADTRFSRRTLTRLGLTAIATITVLVPVHGQMPSGKPAFSSSNNGGSGGATVSTEVRLMVGRSTIINHPAPITRVSLTTPDVADALVTTSQQVLVHGKSPGTISLMVWDRTGSITTFEVIVERDLSSLQAQMKQLFPGEDITVTGSGKDVVVSGTVTSKYVVEKAADVAAGYVEKKENVVNLLRQEEGVSSNQVMLRVRFAEVSRSALQELGVSLFTGPGGWKGWYGRSTTQQFAAPIFDEGPNGTKLVFSDFLNLFLFDAEEQLGGVLRALNNKGLFQSLAEPNLIAQNGKEASFLAGGEYPYPVVQGSGSGLAVTIHFKEFGIRLNFTPTILQGDVVHLKVRPEVSALDFQNAVNFEGFRVPALSTRRADTEVELRDGQTFAIAGLLNNTLTESMQKIPGIGDIPILGYLFRSRALQKHQTELVVMVTPHILRRNSVGASPRLPSLEKEYLKPLDKPLPPPPPYNPQADGSLHQRMMEQEVPVNSTVTSSAAPDASAAATGKPATAPAPMMSEKEQKKADKARAEALQKAAKAAEEQRKRDVKAAEEQRKKAEKLEKELEKERAKAEAKLAKKQAKARSGK